MSWIKWETCKQTWGKPRARGHLCHHPPFYHSHGPTYLLSCICFSSSASANLSLLIPAPLSSGTSETVKGGLQVHVQNNHRHPPTPPARPQGQSQILTLIFVFSSTTHTPFHLCVYISENFLFQTSWDFHINLHIVVLCDISSYSKRFSVPWMNLSE